MSWKPPQHNIQPSTFTLRYLVRTLRSIGRYKRIMVATCMGHYQPMFNLFHRLQDENWAFLYDIISVTWSLITPSLIFIQMKCPFPNSKSLDNIFSISLANWNSGLQLLCCCLKVISCCNLQKEIYSNRPCLLCYAYQWAYHCN